MRRRWLILVGVPVIFLLPCGGKGMDLVVHLIDARTGKPLPKKPIRVWAIDGGPPYVTRPGHLEDKTGPDGTALFSLTEPLPTQVRPGPGAPAVFRASQRLPSYLLIHAGMGGYWEECGPNDKPDYDVNEVLTRGVSKEGICLPGLPKIDHKFQPRPGEVYIFVVHLSLWERLRYCGDWGCRAQ